MENNKLLSMLGLAARAGKIVSGEFAAEKSVKNNSAKLVIVATDASDNTKKLFGNKCAYYKVPNYVYGTKEELGHSIGKEYRASVAILDNGFAKSIIEKLDDTAKTK